MWVILRRHSPNALKLAAANADDRHPDFIVKLGITLHLQQFNLTHRAELFRYAASCSMRLRCHCRCSGTGGEKASGVGKATRLLTDARHSLAKAAIRAAGRQDGNNGKAQRTPQPIHSGAKYEDHNTRRSAHRSNLPRYDRADLS